MQQTNGSVNSKGVLPDIEPFSPSETGNAPPPRCCQQFSSKNIACEQALQYLGKRNEPRENARAKVLAASPLARAFSRDSFHPPK